MLTRRIDSLCSPQNPHLKIWDQPPTEHSSGEEGQPPPGLVARANATGTEPQTLFTVEQVTALMAAIRPAGALVLPPPGSVNNGLNDQRTMNTLVATKSPKRSGLTAKEVAAIETDYFEVAASTLKPRTLCDYETFWTSYRAFCRSSPGSESSPADSAFSVRDVTRWLQSTKWGPTRRGTAIGSLKAILNWAVKHGLIRKNPLAQLEKPTAKRRKTFATAATVERLLSHLPPHDPFRDYVILAWETGARPSELLKLTPAHVDLPACRAELSPEECKTNTERRLYLSPNAVAVLTRLIPLRKPHETLLLNTDGKPWTLYALNCRCRRLRTKLNLPTLSPYEFRHGFCYHRLDQGTDLLTTAKLMGHANTDMVAKVYSHLEENDRLLRNAVGS